MSKKIFIAGNKGNMGRRYTAICDYLGIKTCGIDLDEPFDPWAVESSDYILIASPSDAHVDHIYWYGRFKKPILVEKPISKNIERLEKCVQWCRENNVILQQVNQYAFCKSGTQSGTVTYYDYWNSGRDGYGYDHISIIGLATGKIIIGTSSPIWKCTINGREMDKSDMDMAYIRMIGNFIEKPQANFEYILSSHKAVERFLNEKSNIRNTSKID